jgi:hypothetical protein
MDETGGSGPGYRRLGRYKLGGWDVRWLRLGLCLGLSGLGLCSGADQGARIGLFPFS